MTRMNHTGSCRFAQAQTGKMLSFPSASIQIKTSPFYTSDRRTGIGNGEQADNYRIDNTRNIRVARLLIIHPAHQRSRRNHQDQMKPFSFFPTVL